MTTDEARAAQEEQEKAERQADYERRKAAGQLTAYEMWSEGLAQAWGTPALESLLSANASRRRVNRDVEAALRGEGVTA
jgi:hypothetical protein